VKPFAPIPIPLAPEQENPRHQAAQGGGGGTVWTDEAVAHAAQQEAEHRAWMASEQGVEWLNKQPWNAGLPLVRVRRLGAQQHPNGSSVMLYNVAEGERAGSTVTLASLLKQGYRVEVVG